jgi:1-aminocyclopropane-1-carboxylate deaminase
VSLANVTLLRLDRTGGPAPGNKAFKLRPYLDRARAQGISRLVSFGGPWSNHLHALAAVGRQHGLETVGLVRGETETPMLGEARRLGMRIETVERRVYRRRNEREYLDAIAERFAPCLVIPEGGGGAEGAAGCVEIGAFLRDHCGPSTHCAVAVGTGTTLAGIAAGLGSTGRVTGVAALKGATDLPRRVSAALAGIAAADVSAWQVLDEFHCGGFARVSDSLQEFIQAFEHTHQVPLDPVYTGKLLFAIHTLLREGNWQAAEPVVAVHTGGLQGRRGYAWLDG